jgi:hypothetical protein
MPAPERYIQWINEHLGFKPRSRANSHALSEFIVQDLCASSPKIERLIQSDELSPLKNASVSTSVTVRNVDLVLYEKQSLPKLSVRLSVEHKMIMKTHGKAQLNRYGDMIAYCNHMHNHRRECVVGATVVINTSALSENPNAFARGLTPPKLKMEKVLGDTFKIFGGIPLRESPDDPHDQPEALTVIVVEYDGVNPASLVTSDLARLASSQAYYDNFIARLAEKYQERFCK